MDSDCPDLSRLELYLLGRIPDAEVPALEDHLARCPRCMEQLEKLTCTDSLVEAMRGADRPEEPCTERVQALIHQFKGLSRVQDTIDWSGKPTSSEPTLFPFLDSAQEAGELGGLGHFRIRQVLGQGGMGVVFRAEDLRLKRQVALKVIKPELLRSPEMRQRFRQEAENAAAVEHENIVPIHQIGEEHGVDYLVMPLLRGESLEERLQRVGGPLPIEEVLGIGRQIAVGLAAAHQRQLIHRDIKPGNVFLCLSVGDRGSWTVDPEEERNTKHKTRNTKHETRLRVKILDFGLSKALDHEEPGQGGVVGTLAYMAPEQAAGQPLDGRADLFSLGCVLYRMATGQLPFQGHDIKALLRSIATQEPAPPAQLCPTVPASLSRLILALLAKQPEQRPATAQEVATDLARLEEAILGRWLSRRRWLALAGLLGLAGLGSWFVGRTGRSPPAPGEVTLELDDEPAHLLLVHGEQSEPLTLDHRLTRTLPPGDYGLSPADRKSTRVPVPDRFVVKPGDRLTLPLRLVGEINLNEEHDQSVWDVAFTPRAGEAWVLSASLDRRVSVWDAASSEKPKFFTQHEAPVRAVAFAPNGRQAASGGGGRGRHDDLSIRLWNILSREQTARLVKHKSWVLALAFAPDGRRLASGGADGEAYLWDLDEEQPTLLKGHDGLGVHGVAWTPDGKQLLSVGGDGKLIVWDTASGRQTKVLHEHQGEVRSVAVAGNDRAVTAGDDGLILLWDLKTWTARSLTGHDGAVYQAVFLPDGRRVLSGGVDQTVRLWEEASGKEIYCFKGHRGIVHGVACAGDGRRAVSCGQDGTVRFWELPR